MALLKNGQDDDFFGNDADEEDCLFEPSSSSLLRKMHGDDDGIINHHHGQQQGLLFDNGSGLLAAAESFALEERFRKLGFHEGYDQAKDERLQEGFEIGYKEAFAVSTRIGILLGEATLKSKLLSLTSSPAVDTTTTTKKQIQNSGGNDDDTSSGNKMKDMSTTTQAQEEPIYLAAARQIIKSLTEPETETLSNKCDNLNELESKVRNIMLQKKQQS